jgi:menaquinone-dependent protoporphyrinogen IX oxidase
MSTSKLNRREFLQKTGKSLLALQFGLSLSELVKADPQKQMALIYATRYGATKDTMNWIAHGLNRQADILNIEQITDFSEIATKYDYFVVGSGIWKGIHQQLSAFLTSQSKQLSGKVLGSFVVCGSSAETASGKRRIEGYLNQIYSPLGYKPTLNTHFGGRLIVEKLTEEDKQALTRFYRLYLNQALTSWDRTEPDKANQYGADLQKMVGFATLYPADK